MYQLKNDFRQYNNVMSAFMEFLIKNSRAAFQQQIRNGQLKNINHEIDILAESILNVEEYLHYIFEKSPEKFNGILNATINNIRTISVLPKDKRGIYGESQPQNKIIYINPDLTDSGYLTGGERTKLYMVHEIGHIINNEWMKKVMEYAKQQFSQRNLAKAHSELFYDGFAMLDEAIAQNRAEEFVYETYDKKRPSLLYYRNNRLFNSKPYKSNFDYYGQLQEPAIMFARTLRGIGKEKDDVKALNMLSERALLPDFFDKILSEYRRDGQMSAFLQEVKYMGLLKRASYANFGYGDVSYLQNSGDYLEKLKKLSLQLRDYRIPFGDGDGFGER